MLFGGRETSSFGFIFQIFYFSLLFIGFSFSFLALIFTPTFAPFASSSFLFLLPSYLHQSTTFFKETPCDFSSDQCPFKLLSRA